MSDIETLKGFFAKLQITEHGLVKNVSGGSPLTSSFDLNAEDFLEAAEEAFELSNYASALSDAKRAIYCQIDEVLDCLGYQWKKKPITPKLEIIKKCGFAAPRILKRVNSARNLLEHEYIHPSASQTEEALDIAALFVDATRRHLESFTGEFYIGNTSERVDEFHSSRELAFSFDDDSKEFQISAHDNVSPEIQPWTTMNVGKLSVSASSALFPILVKLTVAGDRDSKVRLACHELFDLFRD